MKDAVGTDRRTTAELNVYNEIKIAMNKSNHVGYANTRKS